MKVPVLDEMENDNVSERARLNHAEMPEERRAGMRNPGQSLPGLCLAKEQSSVFCSTDLGAKGSAGMSGWNAGRR